MPRREQRRIRRIGMLVGATILAVAFALGRCIH
jgi:hypothetical protein